VADVGDIGSARKDRGSAAGAVVVYTAGAYRTIRTAYRKGIISTIK
jgi:hypothetical protein